MKNLNKQFYFVITFDVNENGMVRTCRTQVFGASTYKEAKEKAVGKLAECDYAEILKETFKARKIYVDNLYIRR